MVSFPNAVIRYAIKFERQDGGEKGKLSSTREWNRTEELEDEEGEGTDNNIHTVCISTIRGQLV